MSSNMGFSFATPEGFCWETPASGEKFEKNPFSVSQRPKVLVQPQPFRNEFEPPVRELREDESKFDFFRFDFMKPFLAIFGFSESNSSENELKNDFRSIYSSSHIVGSAILSLAFFVMPSLIGFNKNREGNQEHDMNDVDVSRLVTVCFIGTPTGCILMWTLAKHLTEQKSMFFVPRVLAWFLLAISNISSNLLFLSFALLGFGDSIIGLPIFFHARKTNDPIVMIASGFSAFIGYIIVFNLGMFLSWRHLASIGLIIHIFLYFIMNSNSKKQIVQSLKDNSVQFLHEIESRNYQALFEELKTTARMYLSMALNATRDILVKFLETDTIGGPLIYGSSVHGPQFGEHFSKAISCLAAANKMESIEWEEDEDVGIVIGIDLGNTDSCISVCRDGRVEVVANEEGKRIIPSYVSFSADGNYVVGDAAKDQLLINPENTIFNFKRLIGLEFKNPIVQSVIETLPFKVVERNNRPCIHVQTDLGEQRYEPEQIYAMVLNKMKEMAEAHLGEKVTHAVVTIPANFNNAQRRAIMDAGKIANLNILRIINEPTAVVIKLEDSNKKSAKKVVLVYKLGGGSFDVTLLEMNDTELKVLATDGNTHLGGDDFTRRVVDHFISLHKQQTGIDINKDKFAVQKLRLDIDEAKKELCLDKTWNIEIKSKKYELTRSKFEELNMDLFQSTITTMKKVINDAKMNKKNVDSVLMYGESTQIPKIQQLVKEFFEGKKLRDIPKEAAAGGTEKEGRKLAGEDPNPISVTQVTSLSLGIELYDGRMSVIIPRNTTIPMKLARDDYKTVYDNQTSVDCTVYEGEHKMAKENHFLGNFKLNGIRPAPAGIPKFEVTMEIDINGLLRVLMREIGTTNQNSTIINYYHNRLSDEEIKRMKLANTKN